MDMREELFQLLIRITELKSKLTNLIQYADFNWLLGITQIY